MKVTKQYLKNINACSEVIEWFINQKETDSIKIIKKLIKENKLDWANWFICRLFNKKQRVKYAIYAAKLVLPIFEKVYPDDKRPRIAIQAAKAYLKRPCKNTKASAYAAAYAADAAYAAYAADAAYAAAYADEKEKILQKCADITRKHIPWTQIRDQLKTSME